MNRVFSVAISCIVAIFCVNLVVSHPQLQQNQYQQPQQYQQQQQAQQFQPQQYQQQQQPQQNPQLQQQQQSQPQPGGQENPVTQTCLGCICEAISGCNRTSICTDNVCGLFRLTWGYWADSGKPTVAGESSTSQTAYANCANDPFCAASAVQGYMKRFGQDCNDDGRINCYDHAAIHYRGGYGCKGELPQKYATVFNSCLQQFLNN